MGLCHGLNKFYVIQCIVLQLDRLENFLHHVGDNQTFSKNGQIVLVG